MQAKPKVLKSFVAYQAKLFDVIYEDLEFPNGKNIERCFIKHIGAVVILPLSDKDELTLVLQYRHAMGKELLEFPAGTMEVGEPALDCAKRELAEEVGVHANIWKDLGMLYPLPGYCNEIQHCFFAADFKPAQAEQDEDEIIQVQRIKIQQFEKMILSGEINDAKTIALFQRARLSGLL